MIFLRLETAQFDANFPRDAKAIRNSFGVGDRGDSIAQAQNINTTRNRCCAHSGDGYSRLRRP